MMIGRFTSIAPAILVGAVGAADGLGAKSTQSSTGEDFATAVLGQVAVLVAAAGHESADACTGKSTFGQLQLVVVVVMGAAAALTTYHGAANVVVVVAAVVIVVPAPALISGHGIVLISAVRADVAALMAVVVLFVVRLPLTPDHFAVLFAIAHDHDAGLLARENDGSGWWRFLDDDLLRFWHLLADDDGGGRRVGLGVIFGLLAVALYFVAVIVVEALLKLFLDLDLIVVAGVVRAAVPVAVSIVSGHTRAVRLAADISLDIALVIDGARAVATRFKGRAWPVRG